MTGIERFLQIVDADIEIFDEPDAVELKDPKGEISFEKVSFEYPDDHNKVFTCLLYTSEKRYLKVVHDKNRVSYQTFLVFTHIPEVLEHPGNEWLYMLQQMNVQAEVCIHIKTCLLYTSRCVYETGIR